VSDAASSTNLTSSEQQTLHGVVDFYGPKGDDNVSVSLPTDPSIFGGSENPRGDGGTAVSIAIKPGLGTKELAANIAHEGQHGVDDRLRGRNINSRAERLSTEISAYTTQALFQKAIHFSTSSHDGWTPLGGFNLPNILDQAQQSVNAACRSSHTGTCGD
jgi:hypothetical protein